MRVVSRRRMLAMVGGGAVAAGVGSALAAWPRRDGGTRAAGDRRAAVRTSFGSVVLLQATRLEAHRGGAAAAAVGHAGGHHGHHGPAASAGHAAWTDAVEVRVAVRNELDRDVRLSPGQFRIRVAGGPTVSLYSADRDAAPLAAGSTARLGIHFLSPTPDQRLSLEFSDPAGPAPLLLGHLGPGSARSVA